MMKLKENQTLNQFNLMITDRPIYCSGLSDICTSQALLLKGQYQDYINKGQVDLVISGNSEQYERTYPKFEYKNQDQSDPTYIQNAKYPVYVNINGPRSIQSLDEWGLQKQQWSAMLRKQASYGMIQIAPFQAYQLSYSQFDQNGNQIDNLIIEKKQAISQFIKNTLLSILKIVLMLAVLYLIGILAVQFGKNQLKYKQAIFEGIPIIDDERGLANKNQSLNTIQHQRLTTRDPDQLKSSNMDNEEGVELMDLSQSRRNNIIHRGRVHFDESSIQSITDDNFSVSTQATMSSIKSQPPNFQFGIMDEHFVIRNANRDLMEDLEESKTTVPNDRMAPFQQFMAQRNQVANKEQQKLAAERMRREIENRLNEDIVEVKKTKKTKVKQRKNQDKSK
eukprot:403367871